MSENQNVKWKRSCRDEYLKLICGFANAQGGVLEIAKNDRCRQFSSIFAFDSSCQTSDMAMYFPALLKTDSTANPSLE